MEIMNPPFYNTRQTMEYIADLTKYDLKARYICELQTNTIHRDIMIQMKLSMYIIHIH